MGAWARGIWMMLPFVSVLWHVSPSRRPAGMLSSISKPEDGHVSVLPCKQGVEIADFSQKMLTGHWNHVSSVEKQRLLRSSPLSCLFTFALIFFCTVIFSCSAIAEWV